jgi:hypothetical protein
LLLLVIKEKEQRLVSWSQENVLKWCDMMDTLALTYFPEKLHAMSPAIPEMFL